jgi:hypothetical protein
MIYIPPGRFMMGSDDGDYDEKPAHEVDIVKMVARESRVSIQIKKVNILI